MTEGTKYRASYAYEASDDSQLTLAEGEVFLLIEPDNGGWFFSPFSLPPLYSPLP